MTWFRYLPIDGSPSFSVQDEDYLYPLLKRVINFPAPNQTIPTNSWMFVDVEGLGIDEFIDDSLVTQEENNSYIVVYESKTLDDYNFVPVKSQILNNRLYFKTTQNHLKEESLEKQYSLYYKTKDIKSIKKVQNGQYEDFIACPTNEAEYITSTSEIDETSFDVYPNTSEAYGFSFSNIDIDWRNGTSLSPGAKAIGTFSGPLFELFCNKGPDFGKFELRIISLSSDATPVSIVEQDWTIIDLYNSTLLENQLVFSKNNLYYKNYIFEIVSNFEKNDLSSGGAVPLHHYSYSYDAKCSLGQEEISPYVFARKINGGPLNGQS